MPIAHIFNEVKPKDKTKSYKDEFIDTQPFEIEYFKNYTFSGYEDNAVDNDFSKKYYHALSPIEDRSIISKYDDEKLRGLIEELGDDLLLISGDFWGIQKFIFDGLTTSKASKILRSRSAMIQLITYAVVERIKEEFKGSEALLFGAGKFMILAKNGIEGFDSEQDEAKAVVSKLKDIQKELDSYFLENFFGQNGFILSSQPTKAERLLHQKDSMRDDLDALGTDNDSKKLNKFDLLNVEDDEILIDPFKEAIKDNKICEFCHKRVESVRVDEVTLSCKICANQIRLGKELTKKDYVAIYSTTTQKPKEHIEILKLADRYYYATFSNETDNLEGDIFDITHNTYFDYPKWSLKSHIAMDELGDIKTFGEYIEKYGKTVSSGLMALKADIDKLGDTFREFYKEDFKKFNRLSREVEFFFSDYITSLVAKKNNVYTVFAGGDDLFLIGEYREIVDLAKEIRDEFYRFSLEKTTISMGLVMFKPSTPITFVSKMADEAEKRAKAVLRDEDGQKSKEEITKNGLDRDGIDIFGIPMKYDEFIAIEKDFREVTDFLEKESDDKTALYYRLIELCDMRENIQNDIRNAMWKSKLNYLFRRNVKREDNDSRIFTKLSDLIEKGEKFKPSIFLKIYNNRDKKKENRDD